MNDHDEALASEVILAHVRDQSWPPIDGIIELCALKWRLFDAWDFVMVIMKEKT